MQKSYKKFANLKCFHSQSILRKSCFIKKLQRGISRNNEVSMSIYYSFRLIPICEFFVTFLHNHLINTMEKRNRLLREMNEKVSEYPELKKVMETLGKMGMKSMNFIDLSAKMEITEEQLDDILVHNIQYFNMHEREGRVKVSLSPLCRKILNFKKKEGGCKN